MNLVEGKVYSVEFSHTELSGEFVATLQEIIRNPNMTYKTWWSNGVFLEGDLMHMVRIGLAEEVSGEPELNPEI